MNSGIDLKGTPMWESVAENSSTEAKLPLPPPWEEHFSDNYNTWYYYNPETGESSWERPVVDHGSDLPAPPPPSDPASVTNDPPSIPHNPTNGSSHSSVSQLQPSTQNHGKGDIAQRSKLLLEAKKRREETLRRQREEQEREQIVGAPQITKKSQKLQRSVDTMLAWNEEKQKRLEEKQLSQAALQQAELTGRPQLISKQSAKILEQSARYDDELTVEERLLEYEERKRLKHIARIQEENLKARQAASQTARSHGSGAPARLYDQAASRRAAREQQIVQAKQNEMRTMFQPKINKTSAKLAQKIRPAAPIEDILNDQGKRYQHNAELRKQRSDIKDHIQRNAKKLNPTSERILQSRESDASGVDRLLKPTGNVRMSTIYSMDLPTFRPQLTTNHASSSQPAGDIYTKSQKWLQDKEKRLQQQRLQYEEEQMQECSFTPFASDNTVISGGSGGSGGFGSGSGVLERTLEWQRRKERDIERMRTEQLESELKECSFAPKRVTAGKYTGATSRAVPPSYAPPQPHTTPPPPAPGHFSQPAIASLYNDLHSYDDGEPYPSPYGQPGLPPDDDISYDAYNEQFEQMNNMDGYDISELDIDGFDECGAPPYELNTSFDIL